MAFSISAFILFFLPNVRMECVSVCIGVLVFSFLLLVLLVSCCFCLLWLADRRGARARTTNFSITVMRESVVDWILTARLYILLCFLNRVDGVQLYSLGLQYQGIPVGNYCTGSSFCFLMPPPLAGFVFYSPFQLPPPMWYLGSNTTTTSPLLDHHRGSGYVSDEYAIFQSRPWF